MDLLKKLEEYKDENYSKFNSSLKINNVIGVKTQILKEIAKDMVKNNDYLDFLNQNHKYHEENILHILILSNLKDPDFVYNELDKFVPKIDNWASCDNLNNLKIIKRNRELFFKLVEKYKNSKNEFEIRFSIVMLLFHYVNDLYVDIIFKIIEEVKNDYYYTKMAIAWLLCELMIKYRDRLLDYLKISKLDDFTINKAISKMHDSFRISDEDKELLKNYKR